MGAGRRRRRGRARPLTEADVRRDRRAPAPNSASRWCPRRRHRPVRRRQRGRRLRDPATCPGWTAILEIDADNLVCVVQPGVVNNDLKAAVAEHGLWYPPDPASAPWSTIGGNVATNAGGLCCLKYGVTRDYVLGLRGRRRRAGRRYGTRSGSGGGPPRASPGYDLVGPVRRLRGHARRDHRGHAAAAAGPRRRAADRRRRLRHAGRRRRRRSAAITRPRAGPRGARAAGPALPAGGRGLEAPGHRRRRGGAAAGPGRHPRRRRRRPRRPRSGRAFEAAGALWAEQSTDDVEAEALFDARRLAYPALERLGPVLTEDVCVPAVQGAGDAGSDRGDRDAARRAASPPSRTPATATCTR